MAATLYESSQDHIAEAESALRSGDIPAARDAYARAAADQERLVNFLPASRSRTRATYGLSAATLYFRANLLDESERIVCQLIADPGTEADLKAKLRDLYARIDNERLLSQQGLVVAGRTVSLWFHGPRILHGLAPPDLITGRTDAVINCLRRVAAALGGQKYQRQPRSGLAEFYEPLMSQPQVGSYRFDIHLAMHEQPPLDLGEGFTTPDPGRVVDTTLGLLHSIENQETGQIRDLLPEAEYQRSLVRLVRNMLPDGKGLRELQIRDPSEPREKAVTLSNDLKQPVNHLLDELQPSSKRKRGKDGTTELPVGVLRAVDLDSRDLRLDGADGERIPIHIPESIGDDEIGVLLNRRVQVREIIRRQGKKLFVADLEPAEA